jgi:hypothetical protein
MGLFVTFAINMLRLTCSLQLLYYDYADSVSASASTSFNMNKKELEHLVGQVNKLGNFAPMQTDATKLPNKGQLILTAYGSPSTYSLSLALDSGSTISIVERESAAHMASHLKGMICALGFQRLFRYHNVNMVIPC